MADLTTIGLLGNTVLILVGLVVFLIKNRKNGNGRVAQTKFDEHQAICTERWMEVAEDRGKVDRALDSIDKRLENIEKCMNGK